MKYLLVVLMLASSAIAWCGELREPNVFLLKAADAAARDFASRLRASESIKWQYSNYVSDIENYNIGIARSDRFYVVVFMLRPAKVKINGGGGTYFIDKKTLKVVRFEGWE